MDVRHGDCRELMAAMPEASVDSIVTDPPYGLEFMGKEWDKLARPKPGNIGGFADGNKPSFERVRAYLPQMQQWHFAWAEAALRVLKPGGHLLAFGGTRTFHRLTCALEDAGFEIRDCLSWLYGSGFPKSLDVSKAIDKAAGAERAEIGPSRRHAGRTSGNGPIGDLSRYAGAGDTMTAPATDAAREWQGWGTALKPAWEPIVLARKPLVGTVAANVQEHGTGALNVDGCRIGTGESLARPFGSGGIGAAQLNAIPHGTITGEGVSGRWPANLVLDEEAARTLDEQSGERPGYQDQQHLTRKPGMFGVSAAAELGQAQGFNDTGGASRFFYTAKASSGERHYAGKNGHPTVKPVELMRWLCRLVTPKGGLVLDPFCGSGSTGVAALAEGFLFVGIEQDATYCETARRRIAGPLFVEA